MKQKEIEERKIILNRPEKRPYGVRIQLHVMTYGDLGNLQNVCILLDTGAYFTIKSAEKAPWEAGQKLYIELEGFATASAAEHAGRKLIQSILWCAVKKHRTVKLNYQTYEPAYVFERNCSNGISLSGYGEIGLSNSFVVNELCSGYSNLPEPNPNILLSMEIFAASKLETSERAKFLSMVSAFELLAECKYLGDKVSGFIENTVELLQTLSDSEIPEGIKKSLSGRLNQLKKESIRQALKRFITEYLPDQPEALSKIDEAYSIRSQITHAGRPNDLDIDLNSKIYEFENLIIKIYEKLLSNKTKKANHVCTLA